VNPATSCERLRLACDPAVVAEARRAVTRFEAGVPETVIESARLLVSELVTNAVRHANLAAGDVILLVIDMGDRTLRVEVHDPGGGFVPTAPAPDPARPSGWGLYLVGQLADRWGVDSDERTLVWFELDRPAAAA